MRAQAPAELLRFARDRLPARFHSPRARGASCSDGAEYAQAPPIKHDVPTVDRPQPAGRYVVEAQIGNRVSGTCRLLPGGMSRRFRRTQAAVSALQ
jgi:hypothetical protein